MDKMLETMLKNIEQKSGKKIDHWLKVIKNSGHQKHSEKLQLLKEEYGFTHGYANTLVQLAKKDSAFNTSNEDLITKQYRNKEHLHAWYEQLIREIKKFGADMEIAPKKSYVSLRRKKQFALIQPSTKKRLDIGLNLKHIAPQDQLEESGSFNAMCSHRIRIEDASDINPEVIQWLQEAYNLAG